jgi:uncharacterized protein YodC (DUF2158 family)
VLKLGDTVTLNSGGHLMTLVSVDEDSVTCAWSVNDQVKSIPAKRRYGSAIGRGGGW